MVTKSRVGGASDEIWQRVETLVDRLSIADAQAHKLGGVAAQRRRELGLDVPDALAHDERAAKLAARVAGPVLARARRALEGQVLLLKGPEVAARYRGWTRRFSDLDLLVEDAVAAQRALIADGFLEVPDPDEQYRDLHHLVPLVLENVPLKIELHHAPLWPRGLEPPPTRELREAAVPSAVGVEGIDAPAPHHHALLLVGHSWAHMPLGSVRELVDVALLAAEGDRGELEAAARRWRIDGAWRAMDAAARWLLGGGATPLPVRVWARHLRELREPTVLEGHLTRWFSPYSLLPPSAALRRSVENVVRDVAPGPGETWGQKAARIRRTARSLSAPKSDVGWEADEESGW